MKWKKHEGLWSYQVNNIKSQKAGLKGSLESKGWGGHSLLDAFWDLKLAGEINGIHTKWKR